MGPGFNPSYAHHSVNVFFLGKQRLLFFFGESSTMRIAEARSAQEKATWAGKLQSNCQREERV
jgi:hypothetical protein